MFDVGTQAAGASRSCSFCWEWRQGSCRLAWPRLWRREAPWLLLLPLPEAVGGWTVGSRVLCKRDEGKAAVCRAGSPPLFLCLVAAAWITSFHRLLCNLPISASSWGFTKPWGNGARSLWSRFFPWPSPHYGLCRVWALKSLHTLEPPSLWAAPEAAAQ